MGDSVKFTVRHDSGLATCRYLIFSDYDNWTERDGINSISFEQKDGTKVTFTKEKTMYREFKAGDRVLALRDVHSEDNGNLLFARGEVFTLREEESGRLIPNGNCSYVYAVNFCSSHTIDRTQHFELVEPARKMTVAEVQDKLGFNIEIVEG